MIREKEGGKRITIPETILDLDIRKILSNIENKYHIKLPRRVIALDYGKRGDLYIRFKYVDKPIGEPTEDGIVIFFYDDKDIVALEIMDLNKII